MAEFRAQQKTLVDVETQLLEATDEAAHEILTATQQARPGRATTASARLVRSGLLVATGIAIGALAVAGIRQAPVQPASQPPSTVAAERVPVTPAPEPTGSPVVAAVIPAVVADVTPPPVVQSPVVQSPIVQSPVVQAPVVQRPVVQPSIPTPAPPVAVAAPAPAPAAVAPPSKQLSLREELLNGSQRWLDAYYRQDTITMAKMTIADAAIEDERTDAERLPPGLSDVQRTLTGVTFHQTDTVAMITANMVERSSDTRAAESYVSHLWVRQDGTWQLQTIRLTPVSALATSAR